MQLSAFIAQGDHPIAFQQDEDNTYETVLIWLASEADVYPCENCSEKDRVVHVMSELQAGAAASQRLIVESLQKGIADGYVESYTPHWLVNMVEARVVMDYARALTMVLSGAYVEIKNKSTRYQTTDFDPLITKKVRARVDIVTPRDNPSPSGYESAAGRYISSEQMKGVKEDGLRVINADKMWSLGYTGKGCVMMNIDSGVDGEHPALKSTWRGNQVPAAEAWLDLTPTGSIKPASDDAQMHGTMVMGVMGGLDRDSYDTIGVAFDAQWIAARVLFGDGKIDITKVIAAFEWGMNPDGDVATVADMPDVINCSWEDVSDSLCSPVYKKMLSNIEAIGIPVVFSAGNTGPGSGTITSPKNLCITPVNPFTVGNFDSEYNTIHHTSGRGPSRCPVAKGNNLIKPEVCAPGTNIRSAFSSENEWVAYNTETGSSMAAAYVSGAIVLLKQAFPHLSGKELKWALYETAKDYGEPGEDNTYGKGLIDVYAAYKYLNDDR